MENGDVTYNETRLPNGEYPVDTLARFMCHHAYENNGADSSTCQTMGDWDEQTPTCDQGDKIYRSILMICIFTNTYYKFHYQKGLHVDMGSFSTVSCEPLQNLENGDVTYNETRLANGEYPVDTLATFMCDRAYENNGADSSTCQTTGDWDEQTPTCNQGDETYRSILMICIFTNKYLKFYYLKGLHIDMGSFFTVSCEPLQNLENGDVTYNETRLPNGEYPVDTLATFMCDRAYENNGADSSTCQTTGDWDEQTPTCNQGDEIHRSILMICIFTNHIRSMGEGKVFTCICLST